MKRALFSALLGASALFSNLVPVARANNDSLVIEPLLFSRTCKPSDAMALLRAKKPGMTLVPFGDGVLPWGQVFGAWVNVERNIVVVIKGETVKVEAKNRDVVRARIYHLCNNKLMADGARYIEKTDFKRSGLSIRMKFTDDTTPYPFVDAVFKVVSNKDGKVLYVDAIMSSPAVNNERLYDHFKLIQP